MNVNHLAQRLVALAREEMLKNNYTEISSIHIRLGSQERISEKELIKAFDKIKEDSPLHDTRLVVRKSKTLARCRYCGNVSEAAYIKIRCKRCGSTYMEFISDRGIGIEKVEGK